jgi:hypothetical protein
LVAVHEQERAKRGEGGALVAVNERLCFSNAVGKNRGLHGKVSATVVGMPERAGKSALKPTSAPELIGCLFDGALKYAGMELEYIVNPEIDGLSEVP